MAENDLPILYSFRRCPYAMRARIAMILNQKSCYLREVELKNKPQHMCDISPKATVPVLSLADGHVIEESLDIIYWAFGTTADQQPRLIQKLITECDQTFKYHLDRYKYPNRYPGVDPGYHQYQGELFLASLEKHLSNAPYLSGDQRSIADIAIFPFVRQFANTDIDWFEDLAFGRMQEWLERHLQWDIFQQAMVKLPPWQESDGPGVLFP